MQVLIQMDLCTGENNSSTLVFNKLTEVQREPSQWTDDEIRDAIDIVYQNLKKLNLYISGVVRLPMLLLSFISFP